MLCFDLFYLFVFSKQIPQPSLKSTSVNTAYLLQLQQQCQSLSRAGLCDPTDCRLLCLWNSPGKNTGVGCHALLQGIFPTQRLNPCLMSPALTGEFFTTSATCSSIIIFSHLLSEITQPQLNTVILSYLPTQSPEFLDSK